MLSDGRPRSGYNVARQRAQLVSKVCLVSAQLKAEFAASCRIYARRRQGAVLRAQGLRIGRHRARRLIRDCGTPVNLGNQEGVIR